MSTVFTRTKKDGHRMILNLPNLNDYIEYHNVQMDTLEVEMKLISAGCYMASIDLSGAYYSVPIDNGHQKYLKFV